MDVVRGSAEQQLEQPDKKDFSTQTDESLFDQTKTDHPSSSEAKPLSQYGLRNTVDLGQKCELSAKEEANRGTRSMSAPPEDSRMRNPPSAMGQSASGHSTNEPKPNQQFPNTSSSSNEQQPHVRHIPIFVEGRDEPVVNTNLSNQQFVHQETAAPSTSQKPKASAHGPIFNAAQKLTDPTKQKSDSVPGIAKPQQPPPVVDPITKIQNIQKDVLELMSQVETFFGARQDKQYIFLDEMLTRNLLKLDDVDTEGKENIRQARKEAIKCIQKCISVLEAKADAHVEKVETSTISTDNADVVQKNAENSESTPQDSKEGNELSNTTINSDQKSETEKNETSDSNDESKKNGQNTSENQSVNADTKPATEPICKS